MKKRRSKKGQIWVETVIYTLIAFAMIGLSLSFIKPKIDEIQDKAIIEQSISMLEQINSVVNELGLKDPGNQRIIEIGLSEGELTLDAENDLLLFGITGEYAYSEPGIPINVGNVVALTEKKGELYTVTLNASYDNYDLKFEGGETSRVLSKAPTPYKILILRQNDNAEGEPQINMEILN